ncbi:DUF5783 family protein [Halomarina oriensis]|uniref:Uncharacterized protein n=1 Tax=Halomarina oriensis TaxID=671145 RepID=A0A6B0GLS0_9EURY|nr:DUF5783 family protein [Halomarina oriensis]MWG34429.1 hypothetical protein [Halomarina oriensis]
MAGFDPETFEEEKYVEHFTELQQAYKQAFDVMNSEYDSGLIHGIDQMVLNESEPVYEDGGFRIDLPENAYERLQGVEVERDRFDAVVERYVEELKRQLRGVFDLPAEPRTE